jgi:hypothetical protein
MWRFMISSCHCIIRIIKARRMRWTGHVTCMVENNSSFRILWEKLKERDSSEGLVTDFEDVGWEGLD